MCLLASTYSSWTATKYTATKQSNVFRKGDTQSKMEVLWRLEARFWGIWMNYSEKMRISMKIYCFIDFHWRSSSFFVVLLKILILYILNEWNLGSIVFRCHLRKTLSLRNATNLIWTKYSFRFLIIRTQSSQNSTRTSA